MTEDLGQKKKKKKERKISGEKKRFEENKIHYPLTRSGSGDYREKRKKKRIRERKTRIQRSQLY